MSHPRRLAFVTLAVMLGLAACREQTNPPPPPPFTAIAVGFNHACAISSIEGLLCWGWNSAGQLGRQTTETCVGYPCSRSPAPVSGGAAFRAVAAGGEHTCALDANGAAHCWGSNRVGQLGTSSLAESLSYTPRAVAGGHQFIAITAGIEHTCGVTASHDAYCWGGNFSGQLGTGDTATAVPTPAAVSGNLSFSTIAAGSNFTCGIAAGVLGCWGDNTEGQLGTGDRAPRLEPATVTPHVGIATLATATNAVNICGMTTAGVAYCWGNGVAWALGIGPDSTADVMAPTLVATTQRFGAIAASAAFSCGIAQSGAPYCWGAKGQGEFGQLGTGAPAESAVPVPVMGALELQTLGTGDAFACGLTTAGHVYCWGAGFRGALGRGSTDDALAPAEIVMP